MSTLTVAALQLPLGSSDEAENIAAVSVLVEQAAAQGAQLILPPELFSGPYFCRVEDEALFAAIRKFETRTGVKVDLSQYAAEDMIQKTVAAHQEKVDKIDGLESQLGSVSAASDKAAKTKVLKKNTSSRFKSRLALKVGALTKPA